MKYLGQIKKSIRKEKGKKKSCQGGRLSVSTAVPSLPSHPLQRGASDPARGSEKTHSDPFG